MQFNDFLKICSLVVPPVSDYHCSCLVTLVSFVRLQIVLSNSNCVPLARQNFKEAVVMKLLQKAFLPYLRYDRPSTAFQQLQCLAGTPGKVLARNVIMLWL